jgi:hypothetical protein
VARGFALKAGPATYSIGCGELAVRGTGAQVVPAGNFQPTVTAIPGALSELTQSLTWEHPAGIIRALPGKIRE